MEHPHWPDNQTILLDLQLGSPNQPLIDGSNSWNQVAEEAINLWNQYLGGGVQFAFTEDQLSRARGDGRNAVFFDSNAYGEDFGADTLAITLTRYSQATNVTIETDVIFNSAKPFDSYRGALRGNGAGSRLIDLRRVAIHEFGHVLGLEHTAQGSTSIMAPYVTDIDIMQASDIADVQSIYGSPTPKQPVIISPLSATAQTTRSFSYRILASGLPRSFQASGLPAGINFDSATGVLYGIPTNAGIYNVAISASNSVGSASAILVLTVEAPPVITSSLEVEAPLNQRFSYQIATSSPATNYTATGLPASLNIGTATGVISGFPTVPGIFPVALTVANGAGTTKATLTIKVTRNDNSLVILHQMLSSEGLYSNGPLIQAADGNFYGTTPQGGTHLSGTVYRMTPDGSLTTLHSFGNDNLTTEPMATPPSPDGVTPYTGVIQASDGNLYGTTTFGGVNQGGTLYRLTPDGALTTLHLFGGTEGRGSSALIQGTDGNLYGATRFSGSSDTASIYKVTPAGEFSVLRLLDASNQPSKLVQASDGNLYGTTSSWRGADTVFRCTPGGEFTTLYQLQASDGRSPGELMQASDGNLYGTTAGGGANNFGTIFRVTLDGVFTTVHQFSFVEGVSCPRLLQASDGNLYGAAYSGGQENGQGTTMTGQDGYGTIFAMTLEGRFTTLYIFDGTGGRNPAGSLTQGSDGSFYGVTNFSAVGGSTIFRKGLVPLPTEVLTPTVTVTSSTPTIRVGYGEVGTLDLTLTNAPDTNLVVHYTLGGNAANGTDYARLKGKVKFKPGEINKTIKIKPISRLSGGHRKVRFTLQPGDGYVVGTTKAMKIKILGY